MDLAACVLVPKEASGHDGNRVLGVGDPDMIAQVRISPVCPVIVANARKTVAPD